MYSMYIHSIYIVYTYYIHSIDSIYIAEGSLGVKLPTTWTDEKQRREESDSREGVEERRSEKRKSQRKEAQMREKVEKSRNTVFFR